MYVQKAVDLNRDLATRWAELVTALSGSVRSRPRRSPASCRTRPNGRRPGRRQAEPRPMQLAREQAEQAEQVKRDQEAKSRRPPRPRPASEAAEREQAKQAEEQAREPYEGLTKAELSDQLGRAWPAQVRQRRGAHRAPGRRRPRVTRSTRRRRSGLSPRGGVVAIPGGTAAAPRWRTVGPRWSCRDWAVLGRSVPRVARTPCPGSGTGCELAWSNAPRSFW